MQPQIRCLECAEVYRAEKKRFYERNRERLLESQKESREQNADIIKERRRAQYLITRETRPLDLRWRNLKHSATSRSLPFSLSFDDMKNAIPNDMKCLCCGCEMLLKGKMTKKGPPLNSLSFDRVDSQLGYTKDNVRAICWRCNTLKRDATEEEIQMVLDYIRQNKPS